jgi:thiamine pyrophosphokinase
MGIGVTPDAVVGDFDSLDPAIAARLEGEGVAFVRHPVRKDVTDGELAVDEALRRGAGEVLLAGATGALDHTLGHLAILRRQAARGVAARLVAPGLSVTVLIAPASVRLAAAGGVRVSLVPLGGDSTVTLTGLDYPLDRGALPADACLGIGNHVAADDRATVVVHQGVVAAVVEMDNETFAPVSGG